MKTNETNLESYVDYSYEQALKRFKETEEYRLLQQRCLESETELQSRYEGEEFDFIVRKMDEYIIQAENEGKFLYKQAFQDCVNVLKELKVLN